MGPRWRRKRGDTNNGEHSDKIQGLRERRIGKSCESWVTRERVWGAIHLLGRVHSSSRTHARKHTHTHTHTPKSNSVSQQWVPISVISSKLGSSFLDGSQLHLVELPHSSPSHCLPLSVPSARHSGRLLAGLSAPNGLPRREELPPCSLWSEVSLLSARGCPFCLSAVWQL